MGFMKELINRKYKFSDEIKSINTLLNEIYDQHYAIESTVDRHIRDWVYRNNYISLDQLKKGTGIGNILFKAKNGCMITVDDFISYAEYAINICQYSLTYDINPNIGIILDNIKNILTSLSYEIKGIDEEKGNHLVIIPQSYETEMAIDSIEENDLGEMILMYNHHTNKGNLTRKKDILSNLYKYYEEHLRETIKNFDKTLNSEISELTNSLGIRHKLNDKEKSVVEKMTEAELEEAYDILYKLYLRSAIIADNLKVRPYLEELRNKLREGQK